MRVSSIMYGSKANGPGFRAVLWVQGCTLGCDGCWNPLTHDPEGGQYAEPNNLASHIVRNAHEGVAGLTISGGEPMQQAWELYEFICMVNAIRPDWSIGMFTGYTMAELMIGRYLSTDEAPLCSNIARSRLWSSIQDRLDFAVFGRYEIARPIQADLRHEARYRFTSSANQHLKIYRRYSYDDFSESLPVEFSIGDGGLTQITGFPV